MHKSSRVRCKHHIAIGVLHKCNTLSNNGTVWLYKPSHCGQSNMASQHSSMDGLVLELKNEKQLPCLRSRSKKHESLMIKSNSSLDQPKHFTWRFPLQIANGCVDSDKDAPPTPYETPLSGASRAPYCACLERQGQHGRSETRDTA